MQALAQWWHRWARVSVRHAWGLANHDGAWVLVGLIRHSDSLVKVHTLAPWRPPMASDMTDLNGLSQHLRQQGRRRGRSHQRLNMALPSVFVCEGFLDVPLDLSEENWPYEVQLEVAQACQVPPDEVNFDFEPVLADDGWVHRVHWVGCPQTQINAYKNCVRTAGWRLAAVEIDRQAALRGLRALRGGSASLLTQAPQDWQFFLDAHSGASPLDDRAEPHEDSEKTIEEALAEVMHTPGGARLVAAGLALKAWQ